MRRPRLIAFALAVGMLSAGCSRQADRPGEGPRRLAAPAAAAGFNLLLITIDTLRADRLGCYGYEPARTPQIDALSLNGLRFEQATCSAPVTLPSHATILTGLDVPTHGVRHNGTYRLADERTTLAELLGARGYRTAAVVGAYVLDSRYGLAQGFDAYDDAVNPGDVVATGGRYNERPADQVTDAAIRQLESLTGDDGPFLLWVHYFDPHGPYEPPADYGGGEPYDGEVAFVDAQVGRLIADLRERGEFERTLIVLTSDHGEGLGEHGELTHADLIYDSTMRVPLIFSNTVLFRGPVTVRDRLAGGVDIVPTALALLGTEDPGLALDGRNLIAGPGEPDRAIYIESLVPLLDYGWAPLHGLRRLGDKLIQAPRPEYFDLASDPGELENLFESAPQAAELQAALGERMSRWPSATEVAGAAVAPDREELERLASLGYVAGRGTTEIGVRDPKEMMPLWHRMNLAGRLSLQGEHERAIEEIREVLAADPADAKAWYTASSVYERAGRPEPAEAGLRRALELNPKAEGYVNLARFALNRGDRTAFEAALAEAERLDPLEGTIHLGRGHGLAAEGRFDEALRAFEEALVVDPVKTGPIARQQIARIRAVLDAGTD